MSAISIRLGLLRAERGYSQERLAELAGLSRDTLSTLERGKSRSIAFDTLAKLCDALTCTPNDLLAVGDSDHVVPVLGGADEDALIAERLASADFDALLANPSLAAVGLYDDEDAAGDTPSATTVTGTVRAGSAPSLIAGDVGALSAVAGLPRLTLADDQALATWRAWAVSLTQALDALAHTAPDVHAVPAVLPGCLHRHCPVIAGRGGRGNP